MSDPPSFPSDKSEATSTAPLPLPPLPTNLIRLVESLTDESIHPVVPGSTAWSLCLQHAVGVCRSLRRQFSSNENWLQSILLVLKLTLTDAGYEFCPSFDSWSKDSPPVNLRGNKKPSLFDASSPVTFLSNSFATLQDNGTLMILQHEFIKSSLNLSHTSFFFRV